MLSSSSFLMASHHQQSQGSGETPSIVIALLSSPLTALLRMLSDHTHNTTNHELTAQVADKETLLINCHCTLKKGNRQHLLQIGDIFPIDPVPQVRHRIDREGIASQLQSATILRQQPCKLNPCPSVCYLYVLSKGQRNMGIAKKS